jgi:hypothetical protein
VLWFFGNLVDKNGGDYREAFLLITVLSSTFFVGSFFLPETAKKNTLIDTDKESSCEV